MIDGRPFRDPHNDKTSRRHVGFHPRILRSVMDADDYAESHRDVYGVSDRIIESLNIFIMIYKGGWHRCGLEHWRDLVASSTKYQHCIFVCMPTGETLANAHAQSVEVTEVVFLSCTTCGASTSASN